MIDVKAEKLASRRCEKCGNMVVFDQSKGEKAVCPVCGEAINTPSLQRQNTEVACEQCGLTLNVEKTATTAVCPLCGHANDMAVAMARAKAKASNLLAVLKFEGEQDVLVWKHPIEDFLYGSQLIVHENQEAVFFRDGRALDSFGPGRHTLETQRLPLVGGIASPNATQGEMFHAEVYFVNLATVLGMKWGTDSKVRLFDPSSGLHVELGASGEFNVRVTDARKLLLKVIGTGRDLRTAELLGATGNAKTFFRALVMAQVKSGLARCIRESAINILEVDEHLTELSQALCADIRRAKRSRPPWAPCRAAARRRPSPRPTRGTAPTPRAAPRRCMGTSAPNAARNVPRRRPGIARAAPKAYAPSSARIAAPSAPEERCP